MPSVKIYHSIRQKNENLKMENTSKINILWKGVQKGSLKIFLDEAESSEKMIASFEKLVNDTLNDKNASMSAINYALEDGSRYLCFDPSMSMFDGIAEKTSDGLFDSGDVPAPAFWSQFKDGLLYSKIPANYVRIVNECIELSMSDCIYWKS